MRRRRRATKWLLAGYFLIFVIFLYGPMLVMAVLSLQGPTGGITFPMQGFGFGWWKALVSGYNADLIRTTAIRSLKLAVVSGALVALLALGLSTAYRRRFRGDGTLFYLIMLALMTPGFLLSLGTALFWQYLGRVPGLWQTALGTNVVWGIPFGFLVMVAVWNRYDSGVEEAARDLGASKLRTYREVTIPLIWTGLLGAFLFGVTLSWNEYDRTALLLAADQATLPVQIFAFTVASVIRPDLYALGTATTLVTLIAVGIFLTVAAIYLRRRRLVVDATPKEPGDAVEELPALAPGAAAGG